MFRCISDYFYVVFGCTHSHFVQDVWKYSRLFLCRMCGHTGQLAFQYSASSLLIIVVSWSMNWHKHSSPRKCSLFHHFLFIKKCSFTPHNYTHFMYVVFRHIFHVSKIAVTILYIYFVTVHFFCRPKLMLLPLVQNCTGSFMVAWSSGGVLDCTANIPVSRLATFSMDFFFACLPHFSSLVKTDLCESGKYQESAMFWSPC